MSVAYVYAPEDSAPVALAQTPSGGPLDNVCVYVTDDRAEARRWARSLTKGVRRP